MGQEALSIGEVTVIAVETFFGETCNGGLEQYLGNESGAFGNDVSEALLRVGLREYSRIALDVVRLFRNGIPKDPGDRLTATEEVLAGLEYDPFDRLTDRFFELYHRDGAGFFRERLHTYIFANQDEFVAPAGA